jgi:hypothetical protein
MILALPSAVVNRENRDRLQKYYRRDLCRLAIGVGGPGGGWTEPAGKSEYCQNYESFL